VRRGFILRRVIAAACAALAAAGAALVLAAGSGGGEAEAAGAPGAVAARGAAGTRGTSGVIGAGEGKGGGGVRVVALGTVQDGGLPQAGCECPRCAAARANPALARHVASLAIRAAGQVFLLDATPDIGAQIEMIHGFRAHPAGGPDRRPVDGVVLSHAHIGHYLGLAQLGFESVNTAGLPVWASPRMAAFLRGNAPWSELVRRRNIVVDELAPGVPWALAPGVTVTPFAVPHRDELSDTLGFVIRGPRRALLYVPDTDAWRGWQVPVGEVIERERVQVAILDGTFYSAAELPDRGAARIGHPPMMETMDLLGERVRSGAVQVWFTHLNHSNPALTAGSAEQRQVAARGFRVLAEGEGFDL
jgi:pyrroloquinoline quinone biosynthesis protein B